jgi:hypothetical protein
MSGNEFFYFRMGESTELNPVQICQLDPNIEVYTKQELVDSIELQLYGKSGQPTFCNNNNNILSNLGWKCGIGALDSKIKFQLNANALPQELPTGAWTDLPNAYFNVAIGASAADYTRIRRTGVGAPTPAEMSCGASWSEGICPRNGGHMIFKPSESGGVYPRDQKFALGATYRTVSGSQLNYFQTPVGQTNGASFGTIGIQMVAGALGSALAQPYINNENFEEGDETDVGTPYQTVAGTPVAFCIEWIDPYSMLIKYSLDYDPNVPATDFENATWVTMFDGRDDGGVKLQFPTYIDNFSPMILIRGINQQVFVRGTLSTTEIEAGKWDWLALGYDRDDDVFSRLVDEDEEGDVFVGAYPNIYLNKKIEILGDTIGLDEATADQWALGIIGDLEPTEFSKRIGFTAPIIELLNEDEDYDNYSVIADNTLVISNYIPTMHIQLTNLGIKSKNGVVSNNVKDIAVIPLFDTTPDDNSYHYIAPYENKINLNNLEKLTINELDILITSDENIPATFLTDHSSVVVKIHKGEV